MKSANDAQQLDLTLSDLGIASPSPSATSRSTKTSAPPNAWPPSSPPHASALYLVTPSSSD